MSVLNIFTSPAARKFQVALAAALGVLAIALADGKVDTAEWFQVLAAVVGAGGVYRVENQDAP